MEVLRQWLLSVIVCAIVVSLAGRFTQAGAMHELSRFIGGLLLMLCVLRPVATVDIDALSFDFLRYREMAQQQEEIYKKEYENQLCLRIEEELQTYIEDKASAEGETLRAEIEVMLIDGAAVPTAVTLYGEPQESIAAMIENDIGIARSSQEWREGR